MSSNNAASNVIPMRDFDRPAPSAQEAQFERLLKECQSLALDRLCRSVSAMLDKIEDTLWGLADQTHDRELRDLYIATKDKALAQRKTVEEQFRANYVAEFDQRFRRERSQRDDFSRFDLGSLELGLVNDEDLEETLKVNEMAAKLRRYCEEELNALDQRIGVLIGDANLQGEGNPFSPQAICNAYKQTCRQIEPNLKARMIFHKLFDDHVLDDVRSIYKDLNGLLIQRSILPKIRYGMRRPAGGVAPRPHAGAGAAGDMMPGAQMPGSAMPGVGIPGMGMPGAGIPGAAGAGIPGMGVGFGGGPAADPGYEASAGGEQDFFAVLQSLIAMNAHSAYSGAAGAVAGALPSSGVPGARPGVGSGQLPAFPPLAGGHVGVSAPRTGGVAGVAVPAGGIPGTAGAGGSAISQRLLQGAELIGSLTRLQHGDMGVIVGAPASLDASAFTSGTTNIVRELKSTSFGSSVDQTDGMTMDIVAMLFDQIFGDKRVPAVLKALIGRMQIPVVKVAVLDKKFFSKKSHPARRMLDTLGEFALGLDENFDQTSPVYQKLEEIVQRLLEGFEDNIDIFESLHQDLLEVISSEGKRAEEAAQEAARRVAYMERLEVGKAMSQVEIKRRAEANRMPQLVMNLLVDEWVKLLLLAHARHGGDSDAWKSALETMDLLIWSTNHKRSVEERRKLASLLPGLLKRLHAGLQAIGTKNEVSSQFFARLMRLHTKVISGGAPARSRPVASIKPEQPLPTLTEAVPLVAPDHAPAAGSKDASPALELPGTKSPPLPVIDLGHLLESEQAPAEHPAAAHKVSAQPMPATPPGIAEPPAPTEPEVDDDAEAAVESPTFSNVTIKNPFGDGDIEVEEISLSDLPGGSGLAGSSSSTAKSSDQYSQSVTNLKQGDWLEFRDADDNRTQAKLSYVSPLKGTYLFVNRQGRKVGEYSLYELAREFRTGGAVVLDAVPLFDRAMSSLVGALKKAG
jgi:Protein of unknown function (DUF1631)